MKNPTIDLYLMHPASILINSYYQAKVSDNDDEYADYQDNLCWCGIEFECFNCRNADMPQGGE